jgi:hypothetical protein
VRKVHVFLVLFQMWVLDFRAHNYLTCLYARVWHLKYCRNRVAHVFSLKCGFRDWDSNGGACAKHFGMRKKRSHGAIG